MSDPLEPALSLRFTVDIAGQLFERFTACEGLTGEWEVEEYREGGTFGHVHRLPLRLTWTNVKLTRPVDRQTSALAAWFASVQGAAGRRPAVITAYDGNAGAVALWELAGAWPIRYTGPQLSADGTTAATETLELAHDGFTVGTGA